MEKVTRKTYEAINKFKYQCYARVNDSLVLCSFDGGSRPQGTKGFYQTSNPDVQKALEEKPEFNVKFRVKSAIDVPVQEAKEEKIEVRSPRVNPPNPEELHKAFKKYLDKEDWEGAEEFIERVDDSDLVSDFANELSVLKFEASQPVESKEVGEDEVKTVQEAKDYLREKFDVTAREVGNKEQVLSVAEKKGVKFTALN